MYKIPYLSPREAGVTAAGEYTPSRPEAKFVLIRCLVRCAVSSNRLKYLVFCRPPVFASYAELGPLLCPCLSFSCHTCPHQLCASFLFLFCFIFIFAFFRVYDVGATNGVFLLFPNGFLVRDHGLDFFRADAKERYAS